MDRRIVMHIDMDAFYASVELRCRPDLRSRPVIVGGSGRGVVLSANYLARAHGVRSGMPSARARRLVPRATFIAPDFESYLAVSKAIVEIFGRFTPVVEAASIDEAFLDVSGATGLFGPLEQIGEQLRAVVAAEQQITCSVGIGPTKFVAKMASRAAKPDGLIEVRPSQAVGFLHPMPVAAMWGVGGPTAGRLHRLGISTIGDLAHTPPASLRHAFGPHAGHVLLELAWGRDPRPVVSTPRERSVGSQQTFGYDIDKPDVIRRELLRMADRTARRMRSAGMAGRRVSITVRLADFTDLTRSVTLAAPTDITAEIYAGAVLMLDRLSLDQARIRRLGVRMEQLIDGRSAPRQPELTDPERGWREADQVMDAAIRRFGSGAITRAILTRNRNDADWLDRSVPDSTRAT